MQEIQNNYNYSYKIMQPQTKETMQMQVLESRRHAPQKTVRDEFIGTKKKNGLIERLYDGIKNITGLGTGSNKVKQYVKKSENGEIREDEARAAIDKYRKSQVNGAQAFGDLISVGASGLTFFAAWKTLKTSGAKALLNENYYKDGLNYIGGKYNKKMCKIARSKPRLIAITAGLAALAGGLSKWGILKVNRIGSDEFKTKKKDFNGAQTPYDKTAYKLTKKMKKRERRSTNFRNFISGAINGLMMPITLIGGGIAGVPLYLAGNSLNRYFVGNKTENNKSLNGYIENLKNDSLTHAAIAAAAAVPMIKKARYTTVFNENIKKTVDKLVNVSLHDSGFQGKTTYQQMSDILLNSPEIKKIIETPGNIEERIVSLTKENIFAVKFKQISNDYSTFTTALRENCPATRTIEQAQEFITKSLGNGYQVSKCLGVGTVAETYLAKTPEGKDVCIKVLKDGINAEKILKDKEKFSEIINKLNQTQDEKDYLLKNLDDLADGILKEVDFSNELEAAKKLAEHTKIAKVVKPIEVKNGVYVMEKADGISLSSLIELNSARNYKDVLIKNPGMEHAFKSELQKTKLWPMLKGLKTTKEKLDAVDNYIKQVEARTPQFGDITIDKKELKTLIAEYQQVLVEQFNKVEKGGKVLHADIHPGNIFIDINALKARKETFVDKISSQLGRRKSSQIFTLIDTGNTVNMNVEQSLRSLNLSSYVQKGNVDDIAEYVLDGAALGGKSKEEALKLIKEDLKKCFFDNETALEPITNEKLISMASNIMRKHGITPSDTQLNLNKAIQSANNSLDELYNSLFMISLKDLKPEVTNILNTIRKIGQDLLIIQKKYKNMQSVQEKLNLRQLTLEQRLKQKKNPNMLKTNSEDYLTYKLKQSIKSDKRKIM